MQPVSIEEALKSADETHCLELGKGVLGQAGGFFSGLFPGKTALLIADPNTFSAAGRNLLELLRREGIASPEPFIFTEPNLHAEYRHVEALEQALALSPEIVPIAVGSGTINDLAKLAAHQANRPYMAVATAASMDGYAAFGASITRGGSKRTFPCPGPAAILADLDVIGAAPAELNAAGYADLLAKTTSGADWLLADALGVEPLHPQAWNIVQGGLDDALADPAGVRGSEPEALRRLTGGLVLSGLAMQCAKSSRPASGAEHQFSHLWDMRHHRHKGKGMCHGFQVGIGTLAISALYEQLLSQALESLDVEACCARWPDRASLEKRVRQNFQGDLVEVALKESAAKAIEPDALRCQLMLLRQCWPGLREKLRRQLLPFAEVKRRLEAVGAPFEPEQVGIDREQLRKDFWLAWCIRRRFTVLDLAVRTGLLESGVEGSFQVALFQTAIIG
jgi:glycerol-1-phosphate dehydrogenase [NAD(P)+]